MPCVMCMVYGQSKHLHLASSVCLLGFFPFSELRTSQSVLVRAAYT
jgi:hypothetical protein